MLMESRVMPMEPGPHPTDAEAARALLEWYLAMGVDEAVCAAPADLRSWGRPATPRLAVEPTSPVPAAAAARTPPVRHAREVDAKAAARPAPAVLHADDAVAAAKAAAAACDTPDALAAAVAAFEGCALKSGARCTVFTDGVYNAELLVIGEAPGREEDQIGRPFVGRAGQLLDRMLAAIGRSRSADTLITNVIFWRPPGNRTPTAVETAICKPFVDRLINLARPKAILLAGGAPTQTMTGAAGIMRARGVWREIAVENGPPIPALPIFHPAFLLRQPQEKALAWRDLLKLDAKLRGG